MEYWRKYGILEKVWNIGESMEYWRKYGILEKVRNIGESMEYWRKHANWVKPKYLAKSLFHYPFIHHQSHFRFPLSVSFRH